MTIIKDIHETVSELNRFLEQRALFVRSIARKLVQTLTSEPIGLARDSIDLLDLNADLSRDAIVDENLFQGEDCDGRVGFALRFSLGAPSVIVYWRFAVAREGVAASRSGSEEVIRTHFSEKKQDAFIHALAEHTMQAILQILNHLETGPASRTSGTHPLKTAITT